MCREKIRAILAYTVENFAYLDTKRRYAEYKEKKHISPTDETLPIQRVCKVNLFEKKADKNVEQSLSKGNFSVPILQKFCAKKKYIENLEIMAQVLRVHVDRLEMYGN